MTAAIPDGSVIVTPTQIYAELRETRQSVDKLIATVDPALSNIRADVSELRKDLVATDVIATSTESRVTVLETKLKVAYGAIVLLTAAIPVYGQIVGHG